MALGDVLEIAISWLAEETACVANPQPPDAETDLRAPLERGTLLHVARACI